MKTITHIKGNKVIPHTQQMYKVGFGPNLYGIFSEDTLPKYSNIVGMEYYGERTIYYLNENENTEQQ